MTARLTASCGAILLGTLLAACDTTVGKLGKEISGTVRVPAAFDPALPPVGESPPFDETEPNTVSPAEFNDVGTIDVDSPGVTLVGALGVDSATGDLDPSDIRERFVFRTS